MEPSSLDRREMRKLVIVQGRMGSSRLPGKVLLDIGGQPMLSRVVERSRRADLVDDVVVATTADDSDDPVDALCRQRGYLCYRGSLYDVLDRYYQAARLYEADLVVRITADCPLMDPALIDATLQAFQSSGCDFAATRLPPPWKRTYPIGLDIEVCSFQGLERAWREADQPHQREHVMPFFYEQEGRFRLNILNYPVDYGSQRWTVDTPEDLELIRRIYAHFNPRADFGWLEVIDLFHRQPDLFQVNAGVSHHHYRDVDPRGTSRGSG